MFDETGEISFFISIGKDITQERVLEKTLIQKENLSQIGLALAGFSHDLNNYFQGILTHLEVLSLEDKISPSGKETILKLKKVVKEQASILRKMVMRSRENHNAKKTRSPTEKNAPFDMVGLIEEEVSFLKNLVGPNIEISFHKSIPSARVRCSTENLKRVFLNLIINAKDAISENGTIQIKIEKDPNTHDVLLKIQDSGSGISKENLPHLFKLNFSTKKKHGGSGLGLYQCKHIIEKEGGKIKVESVLGKGTCFFICLPLY